jgi:hypothetical protein
MIADMLRIQSDLIAGVHGLRRDLTAVAEQEQEVPGNGAASSAAGWVAGARREALELVQRLERPGQMVQLEQQLQSERDLDRARQRQA